MPVATNVHRASHDRGAVDVSIQMLAGFVALLMVLLLLFEATAYWHARNVLDEAAAEGARVAAAYDGTCADGVAASKAAVGRSAGSWARRVRVVCSGTAGVTVTITGTSPGVLGEVLGIRVRVSEYAPKER